MSELDGTAFVRFLETFADRLHVRRDELTQLDSAIGDADHGINMDRGFTAVRGKLAELDGADLCAGAKAVGMTLISTVGGAAGPLYGTFFLRIGTAIGDTTHLEPDELAAAFRAGLEGVTARGKAELGDKTMIDAIAPSTCAATSGANASIIVLSTSNGMPRAVSNRDGRAVRKRPMIASRSTPMTPSCGPVMPTSVM